MRAWHKAEAVVADSPSTQNGNTRRDSKAARLSSARGATTKAGWRLSQCSHSIRAHHGAYGEGGARSQRVVVSHAVISGAARRVGHADWFRRNGRRHCATCEGVIAITQSQCVGCKATVAICICTAGSRCASTDAWCSFAVDHTGEGVTICIGVAKAVRAIVCFADGKIQRCFVNCVSTTHIAEAVIAG